MRIALRSALVLMALCLPAALSAQKMEAGTWTGTIAPPNQGPNPVTFDVSVSKDTTRIVVKGTPAGDIAFENVRVLADRVTFTFSPGVTVSCVLMAQASGGYKGNCTDSQGETGVIEMLPPKKDDRPQPAEPALRI